MVKVVTGAAGFIGFHTAKRLLDEGMEVLGIDNLNDYYSPQLKKDRLELLQQYDRFQFHQVALEDGDAIFKLLGNGHIHTVIHLAAQAGVRYSIDNPKAYVDSNIVGFIHILEACRHHNIPHLIYASSSSVYGANVSMPFSVQHPVNHPVSLYAATKKANELMAHTYSHLYELPTTGLRFFTVYGPWGRPDMAYYKFARLILEGKPIPVYNYGRMKRDFTYIDDIVESIFRLIGHVPTASPDWDRATPDPGSSYAPYRIYNIGNHQPVELMRMIQILGDYLHRTPDLNLLPMQNGDVCETFADVADLSRVIQFEPQFTLDEGLKRFVEWFIHYEAKQKTGA
ncbi:NAD-dependent epimerase [Paenibacillus sp. MER TA 81-3]|uniref:NAD-dependent epimerase n=1 Tax=Paenibacillus sp. MER TA 81-3 TaxID=2939573 RepID=UPI002041B4DD|nr:NAD-dependent epimerase [Paenibacillus sp. MER TA 81-3]MCM3338272.1 NAD-dependent epimerase [Paenibacillus sp. MER TA 81-3]